MTSRTTEEVEALGREQLRMVELARHGFHCSQVLVTMSLEAQGKTNPDLIGAVSSLAGGLGFSGEACGALTGGACVLGLYAGRGMVEQDEDPKHNLIISRLVDWFSRKYGERHGGIRCRDITRDDPKAALETCPRLVWSVHCKVKSLLAEHGYDWTRGRNDRSVGTISTNEREPLQRCGGC
jgi:C_GCAxxG_C_C family probable redox protein